jgi:hypothetical protein
MLRLLIEDVTLVKNQKIQVYIRWKAGATTSIERPLPLSAPDLVRTPAEIVELIRALATEKTDAQIAQTRPVSPDRQEQLFCASNRPAHSQCLRHSILSGTSSQARLAHGARAGCTRWAFIPQLPNVSLAKAYFALFAWPYLEMRAAELAYPNPFACAGCDGIEIIRHAGSPPRPRSLFIDDPGKTFFGLPLANGLKTKTENPGLWKVPQLRKSTSVAFGRFFLMIFTSCLESTKRFPHLPPGPAAMNLGTLNSAKRKHACWMYQRRSRNLVPDRRPRWPVLK